MAQRGDRQGQRQQTRDERVANRDQNQQDRQDWRDENREDWQDFANERQEDRQDFWDDRLDEGDWNDVDWDEVDWDEVHIYDDDDFEWGLGTWMAISVGTALTVAAFDTMRTQPGCDFYQVVVDNTEYYRCGSTWYIKGYSGGEVRYVAVNPPAGL